MVSVISRWSADGASPLATFRYITLPLLSPFILLTVTFRTMDSLRIFDVIYATTMGGPNDATTNLQIMALQYSFQWYQMGKGIAMAILLLGERPRLFHLIGYLLVLAGVVIASRQASAAA